MASENESEKRETRADIVAEMRSNGDAWCEDKSMNKTECLGLITLNYANRIDAALKREKAEIEANALAVGGIVEAARHKPGNAAAMREALMQVSLSCSACPRHNCKGCTRHFASFMPTVRKALSAPPHKGKWENGTMYEYEYAYCSECGRMQWAGWDTHKQAMENIESFARDYKFCPGCGTEMEGGVYVR